MALTILFAILYMNDHETLIHRFYSAFQNKDYSTMQKLYHSQAHFSDPVFTSLDSSGVKAMWQMLVTAGKDLRITFQDVKADDKRGSCHWEAWYTFSRTGKKVHNIIDASFEFKDGLILNHNDRFGFWRWSRQALGLPGWLLGWSPFLKNKIQQTAASGLQKFMQR
jgi:hypothetical protein